MDISKKVLIITLLIFAVLTASFTFTHAMQLSNFLELEQADTLNNVGRVQNAISAEHGNLDYLVSDWACWNESYRFVEDRNQRFIDETIKNETLVSLRTNVILFINDTGSVVYAKSADIYTGEEKPIPEGLSSLVEEGILLTKSENDKISGLVLLDEGPMFISCHPILTTYFKGPMKCTLTQLSKMLVE
jgi:sensor domain CHASE-containing protein